MSFCLAISGFLPGIFGVRSSDLIKARHLNEVSDFQAENFDEQIQSDFYSIGGFRDLESLLGAISMPDVFERLCDSARKRRNASDYWHGRMIWIYLISVI